MARTSTGIYTTTRKEDAKEYFKQNYHRQFLSEHSNKPILKCECCGFSTRVPWHMNNRMNSIKHLIKSGNIILNKQA